MSTVRFLHIPKTAGSTLNDSILALNLKDYLWRNHFAFHGNLPDDRRNFEALSPSKRSALVFVTGHAPRITGIQEVDRLPTFTVLREPIERVKSHCQHFLEGKSPEILDELGESSIDLDTLLERETPQLSNLLTKYLLGNRNFSLPDADGSELPDLALTVLTRDLDSFGIAEEFNRSMCLFRQVFQWKDLPVYRKRNVKSKKQSVVFEDRHIARIKDMNRLDLQLYQKALPVFHTRCNDRGRALDIDIENLEQALEKRHVRFGLIDAARWANRRVKIE